MGTIVNTRFGQYEVFPNNTVDRLDPAGHPEQGRPAQVTQAELSRLERAWNNIHSGVGMEVEVDSRVPNPAQARAEFDRLLIDGMTHSQAFRQVITRIGEDTNPDHKITITLGHNIPGVVGDDFAKRRVDLSDIRHLPPEPGYRQHNEMTQRELVLHILAEYHANASHGLPFERGREHAHQAGIEAQNQYREEREQTHIRSIKHDSANNNRLVVEFNDGTRELVLFSQDTEFMMLFPPVDEPTPAPTHDKPTPAPTHNDTSMQPHEVKHGDQSSMPAWNPDQTFQKHTATTHEWDPSQSTGTNADSNASSAATDVYGQSDNLDFDPSTSKHAHSGSEADVWAYSGQHKDESPANTTSTGSTGTENNDTNTDINYFDQWRHK